AAPTGVIPATAGTQCAEPAGTTTPAGLAPRQDGWDRCTRPARSRGSRLYDGMTAVGGKRGGGHRLEWHVPHPRRLPHHLHRRHSRGRGNRVLGACRGHGACLSGATAGPVGPVQVAGTEPW